jgi:peptidyl-prolyl cis-trans isomerase A (cyclophilin A)
MKRILPALLFLAACATTPPAAPPEDFKVRFVTSKGDFVVQVTRAWAPLGADRFRELVGTGFYDGARFFRVLPRFVAQFGIPGDPKLAAQWDDKAIADDPVRQSNTRGRITFATSGPNTRTTQLFVNYADNARLDRHGFSPFGEVVSGMEVVDAFHADYGEGAPQGKGPDQSRIEKEGNAYLEREFPKLDYVKTARLVQ